MHDTRVIYGKVILIINAAILAYIAVFLWMSLPEIQALLTVCLVMSAIQIIVTSCLYLSALKGYKEALKLKHRDTMQEKHFRLDVSVTAMLFITSINLVLLFLFMNFNFFREVIVIG